MSLSAELMRFLADHATAESQTTFASSVGGGTTPAALSAAMAKKGYGVTEDDVVAAFEASKQIALRDQELGAVVGGQATPNGTAPIVGMSEMQMMLKQLSLSEMSTSVVSSTNAAIAATARGVKD